MNETGDIEGLEERIQREATPSLESRYDEGDVAATRVTEVHRYSSPDDLSLGAAESLVRALVRLQSPGGVAQLCLAGGRTAARMYADMAGLISGSGLDTGRLELWWGDERFVPTDDPARNAGPVLALLARGFPVDPARTHPMPSADGVADNADSAATYAKELGDTRFDVCLLGLGGDGHVASVFPQHASFEPTTHRVIAVNDAPLPPAERISISMEAINDSDEVWFLVTGSEKASVLPRAMAGDPTIPGGVARGRRRTVWFVDAEAAAELGYYNCAF